MRNLIMFLFFCVSLLMQRETSATSDKVVSRRKRYLIFPEGSSLQLVYCLTMPVIGKSTIFTIGGTAALAWELPHDPFQPYRKPAELLHRVDPTGKYLIKDPLRNVSDFPAAQLALGGPVASALRPLMIRYPMITMAQHQQPVRFPSIQYSPTYNRYRYQHYRREKLEPYYRFTLPDSPSKVPLNADEGSLSIFHQVHRRTRRDLYTKIEKFLSAQSKDGRACLLKAVCEMHQRSGEKGSFMEAVMRTVFRPKLFVRFRDEDVYDTASNRRDNCTEIYTSCQSSILYFL